MDKRHLPRIHKNKGYKNPLAQYRVNAGLSVKELADLAGVNISTVTSLQGLNASPLYKVGDGDHPAGLWRPSALRIAMVLNREFIDKLESINPSYENAIGVTIEDLFPEHASKIESLKPTHEELTGTIGDYTWNTQSPEEKYEAAERLSSIKDAVRDMLNTAKDSFGRTNEKLWGILDPRIFYDDTLEEAGKKYNMGREAARQREVNALNILKYPRRKSELAKILK